MSLFYTPFTITSEYCLRTSRNWSILICVLIHFISRLIPNITVKIKYIKCLGTLIWYVVKRTLFLLGILLAWSLMACKALWCTLHRKCLNICPNVLHVSKAILVCPSFDLHNCFLLPESYSCSKAVSTGMPIGELPVLEIFIKGWECLYSSQQNGSSEAWFVAGSNKWGLTWIHVSEFVLHAYYFASLLCFDFTDFHCFVFLFCSSSMGAIPHPAACTLPGPW